MSGLNSRQVFYYWVVLIVDRSFTIEWSLNSGQVFYYWVVLIVDRLFYPVVLLAEFCFTLHRKKNSFTIDSKYSPIFFIFFSQLLKIVHRIVVSFLYYNHCQKTNQHLMVTCFPQSHINELIFRYQIALYMNLSQNMLSRLFKVQKSVKYSINFNTFWTD